MRPLPLALGVVLTILALITGARGQSSLDDPPASPAFGLRPLVEGNTAFAIDLHRTLASDENLVFSPYGLSESLAICLDGARGRTAEEMAEVMHLPPMGAGVTEAFADLLRRQKKISSTPSFDLEIGTSLWSQKNGRYEFLESWLERISAAYDADTFEIDLKGPAAEKRITEWVHTGTRGKGVFPAEVLDDPDLQALLVNTLYLKADWATPFQARRTTDRPFHVTEEDVIEVSTMRQTGTFRYRESEGARMLELPYRGGDASMIIILPDVDADPTVSNLDALARVEAGLAASDLMSITDHMASRRLIVRLPRFSVDSRLGVKEAMRALGMEYVFTPDADLSGMTGNDDLKINSILQNARIDVNEAGTEAVAVTAVGFGTRGGAIAREEPIEFTVDRPFLFLVRENATGSVLFMGRVVRPSYEDPEEGEE